MSRFHEPSIYDRSHGPAPGAGADGLEGAYSAKLVSAPSNGTVKVLIPALDAEHFYMATCSPAFGGAPGDSVLVVLDEGKHGWVVSPSSVIGGASAGVSSFDGRTGAVVPASGDYTAAQVTNAADKSSASQQAFTGELKAPDFAPAGLTGATAATRFVGATASGAPVSGTFAVGDFIIDRSGKVWVCTVAGSPGTWLPVGSSKPNPLASPYYVFSLLAPQHYWPFSDISSPAVDQSQMVNGTTVNLTGTNATFGQTASPPTLVSKYVAIASNGFLDGATPSDVDPGNMIVAFWINPAAASGQYVFYLGDSGGSGIGLYLQASNNILINYGGGGRNFSTTIPIPANQWTRVALATFSSGIGLGIRVSLNGQLRVNSGNFVTTSVGNGHVVFNGLRNGGVTTAGGLACSFAEARLYQPGGYLADQIVYSDYIAMIGQ